MSDTEIELVEQLKKVTDLYMNNLKIKMDYCWRKGRLEWNS